MKASAHIFISIAFVALTACSPQEVKEKDVTTAAPAPEQAPAQTNDLSQSADNNPPLTHIKDGTTLNLVRIMDGGACKNDYQGAKGAFLLYADPADITRIKNEKGPQIFSDFENKIETFSTAALQEAINATNLAENPFALGPDEAQEKLAKELFNNFGSSVAGHIKLFQKETSLTIDIVPFGPSFIFYQQGCDAMHLEPEN